jgi:MoaA/NifB/PqqE/SkfB family radical SAM enzyme
MTLAILYRGPLASCNYDCPYCPFAKRRDSRAELAADRAALTRFVDWVERDRTDRVGVLFTPWGEALTRSWYRSAMVRLSRLPHVDRVAAQTNLSCRLDWLADADLDTLAFWVTYHPGQISRTAFLARTATLRRRGVRHSVGIVGLPEHLTEAIALREALPAGIYVWVNAADGHTYTAAEEDAWTGIDPLFGYSVRPHTTLGAPCWAGETAISVRGDGTVRRCHFIAEPLGNLYDGSFREALRARPCTNATCDCHIGYVHLKRLRLHDVFAGGVLERIPSGWPTWGVPPAAVTSGPSARTPRR